MDGYQLDDEPNLYIENGWKSPFPSIYKWLEMGFQEEVAAQVIQAVTWIYPRSLEVTNIKPFS